MSYGVFATNTPVRFNSLEFRDGQQSMLATRVKTEDMIPFLERMDQIGFENMEMWGGATFDVCIRYLNDDPWERLRKFKKVMKNTPLKMVCRGQNLVGYNAYPDDIVRRFIAASKYSNTWRISRFLPSISTTRTRRGPSCFALTHL